MTPVPLPRYDAREAIPLARVHRALIEEDQHDDWIPDVIHYRDHQQRADDSIAAIERTWTTGEIDVSPPPVFPLPRERSEPCPSIVLPFGQRVLAHRVVATMAGRVDRALVRDRVHGFACFTGRAAGPLFSSPSDGITEVWDAAVAGANLHDYLQLVDVRAFNASCRAATLLSTLRRAGARPEETSFIEALLPAGTVGLPSIDDAFAYLYNFYLQPADQSLAEGRVAFLRHRDMYFTFEANHTAAVQGAIRRLDLEPYAMASEPSLRTFVTSEADLPPRFGPRADRPPPESTEPLLWLTLPTANIRITFNLEWTGDAELLGVEIDGIQSRADRAVVTLRDLFARWKASQDALDGVALQPVMRSVHRVRASGVTELPPYAETPNEHGVYRRELLAGAGEVRRRFLRALDSGDMWGASWLSVLLSDLGPLTDDANARAVRELAGRPAEGRALLASHLRLLLARCTTLAPDRFWADPVPETGAFGERAALLAAFYLARRGEPARWTRLAAAARAREPLMVSFLEPYLRL